LDQLSRQAEFVGARQLGVAVGVDQQQGVIVLAKGGRADVAYQQRHCFALALFLGVTKQVMALSRKADAKQPAASGAFAGSDFGQDVGVFGEAQGRHLSAAVFF